jgi:hypothetical protein
MTIFVIVIAAALLGWVFVTLSPKALAYIPATLQQNKLVMIVATGAFILLAFWVIAWGAKKTVGRSIA